MKQKEFEDLREDLTQDQRAGAFNYLTGALAWKATHHETIESSFVKDAFTGAVAYAKTAYPKIK